MLLDGTGGASAIAAAIIAVMIFLERLSVIIFNDDSIIDRMRMTNSLNV